MPRITGETLEQHRASLRQRVFEAFADLMGERSFDAITMAAIAQRADLGRTAIYHHFRDKEAVMVAFASHETERYLDQLRAALAGAEEPDEQLRVYLRHQLAAGEQFHMGLGAQVYGHLSREARLAIREHVVAVEDVLRGILTAGRAAGVFTIDDLDGTMSLIHACLSPRHLPPRTIETFVLRAVGAAG
ncbi:TetR/AcrR family transcriptional regulator [Nocardioides pantholopis]|uniref:TetR/AcrR family transcriptional regulator n=1 Tax=Nocardioides pantholopis TaxID=2483798 RepID=UPI000F07504E|nr:TetR/AcrR family transcriptional regulator [Nocardioides pantholopis]